MKALSLLIKPASGSCNMRCAYCFYADIAESRAVKNYGLMTLDILETLVRKALTEATEYCAFGFQGGEPTLAGLDFYRALIEFEKKYNRNKVKLSHTLQTNGLLLNEEWAEFLRENQFLTGLSIDACKQIHDDLRLDSAGKGTHNRCMNAARMLGKHRAEFNILSVVTRSMALHPDKTYRFYKHNGLRYIQFIPCIDGLEAERAAGAYSLDAGTYGRFLCRIFDLWYEDFIRDDYYSIRAFDNYIRMLAGYPPENCAMQGVCNPYALAEADGSVYPCDFYAADPYLLGNVASHSFTEMLNGKKAEEFAALSRQPDPSCMRCEYRFLCRGGCRRDREPVADGRLALNHYCAAYKVFFQHALPRMHSIAVRIGV